MSQPESERPVPTQLKRVSPGEIEMLWSDGVRMRYRATLLREKCPCATCRERRRGEQSAHEPKAGRGPLPILSAAEAKPLTIERLSPVGNYAYNIALSDGHDSGIFPLELLRQIGQRAE